VCVCVCVCVEVYDYAHMGRHLNTKCVCTEARVPQVIYLRKEDALRCAVQTGMTWTSSPESAECMSSGVLKWANVRQKVAFWQIPGTTVGQP